MQRACVEHVFAQQTCRLVRTICRSRAEMRITMMNFLYNARRWMCWQDKCAYGKQSLHYLRVGAEYNGDYGLKFLEFIHLATHLFLFTIFRGALLSREATSHSAQTTPPCTSTRHKLTHFFIVIKAKVAYQRHRRTNTHALHRILQQPKKVV